MTADRHIEGETPPETGTKVATASERFERLHVSLVQRCCILEEIIERERIISTTLEGEVDRLSSEAATLRETVKKLELKVERARRRRS